MQSIEPQFGKHRYLTKGEASAFLTRDWQIQEATEFAGQLFKRLMYYTCDHPAKFLPEVNEALTAFENRLIAEQDKVVATSDALFNAGKRDLALAYLTDYSARAGQDALELGHALLASIEARTELLYGLRRPVGERMSGMGIETVSCLEPAAEVEP